MDHQIELQRRLLDIEHNPDDESPWEEVVPKYLVILNSAQLLIKITSFSVASTKKS